MSDKEPIGHVAVEVDLPVLDTDQLRRVEALKTSRSILESRTGLFATAQVGQKFVAGDLTYLAEWILTGPKDFDPESEGFESGWSAHRREVLAMADAQGNERAIEWVRSHGLIPGAQAHDAGPLPTVDESPIHAVASPRSHDADAESDLRAARSDADDGI